MGTHTFKNDKAKRDFGYEPKFTTLDGINRVVEVIEEDRKLGKDPYGILAHQKQLENSPPMKTWGILAILIIGISLILTYI